MVCPISYRLYFKLVDKVLFFAHDTFRKNAKYRKHNIFLDFKIQV